MISNFSQPAALGGFAQSAHGIGNLWKNVSSRAEPCPWASSLDALAAPHSHKQALRHPTSETHGTARSEHEPRGGPVRPGEGPQEGSREQARAQRVGRRQAHGGAQPAPPLNRRRGCGCQS